jgi:predicted DNA-binding transcriptional regulator YafY
MPRNSARDRLARLENVASLLKADEHVTVAGLAEELGVAQRTLWRDIQLLRDQGYPIEADRGRGGGVRLSRNWGIGRLSLSQQEAIDLLISLAIAERMNSPLFMANLKSVRRKLIASFSSAMKRQLLGLKARVLVGPSASPFVLSSFESAPRQVVAELHRAFLNQQPLKIGYRDEKASKTTRLIEPHYLLLNYPVWYVLAWDRLRNGTRTFRCDRIEQSAIQDGGFRLRPLDDFQLAREAGFPE